jgi:hypothetical protein
VVPRIPTFTTVTGSACGTGDLEATRLTDTKQPLKHPRILAEVLSDHGCVILAQFFLAKLLCTKPFETQ